MRRVLLIFVCLLFLMGICWLYWPSLEPRLMPVTLTLAGKMNRPSGFIQVLFRLHNGSRKTISYSFANIQYQDQNGHWDNDRPASSIVDSLKPGASATFQFFVAPGVKKARGAVDCERMEEMSAWLFRKRFGINYPLRDHQTIYSPEVLRE